MTHWRVGRCRSWVRLRGEVLRAVGSNVDDSDDWFDPVLSEDTPLYVDPFLLYEDENATWSACHDTVQASVL